MHNTINISSKLPVSAYIQAIITAAHYLELTKNTKQ